MNMAYYLKLQNLFHLTCQIVPYETESAKAAYILGILNLGVAGNLFHRCVHTIIDTKVYYIPNDSLINYL
jgi:hypothetical protein